MTNDIIRLSLPNSILIQISGSNRKLQFGWHFAGDRTLSLDVVAYFHDWCKTAERTGINRIAMGIIVNLDVMLARRKMSLTELSEKVGITMANLSILKKSKAKAVRFSTLELLCSTLDCQPGDILEYKDEENG